MLLAEDSWNWNAAVREGSEEITHSEIDAGLATVPSL